MTSLLELLESLDIKTDDLGEDDPNKQDDPNKIKLDEIKLDDIPEQQRPIFKALIDKTTSLENEGSKKDLIINTLTKVAKTVNVQKETKDEGEEGDEKVLGILDKTDPYAPVFQRLADMIGSDRADKGADKEATFKKDMIAFVKDHSDIYKLAPTMDKITEDHPTMRYDISKLYKLARAIKEGSDAKAKEKADDLKRQKDAGRSGSERDGISSVNTQDIQQSKTIKEAFDAAEKKIASN